VFGFLARSSSIIIVIKYLPRASTALCVSNAPRIFKRHRKARAVLNDSARERQYLRNRQAINICREKTRARTKGGLCKHRIVCVLLLAMSIYCFHTCPQIGGCRSPAHSIYWAHAGCSVSHLSYHSLDPLSRPGYYEQFLAIQFFAESSYF
jgi:hypothetical protein